MRKKRRYITILAIVFSILFFLAALLRARVDPMTQELAMAKVSDVASNRINEAVYEQISQENVRYDDLITLQRDNAGNITALTTNMQKMNQFKMQLLTTLDSEMYEVDEDEISVPIGSLTGMQMLSGRGPGIPVKIVAISSSDANFNGVFSDAGINQTIHRILLDVSLDLIVLLPSGTATSHVSTEVCVAETVLLGPVPESYTYFNSTGGDISSHANS